MMPAVIVNHTQLSPHALNGVIEEFVTRDGTDYGDKEISLEARIATVMGQIESHTAVIVYDDTTQTCTILLKNDPAVKSLVAPSKK